MSSSTANAVSIIIKSRDATPFDNILVYNIQIFFDQMSDEIYLDLALFYALLLNEYVM